MIVYFYYCLLSLPRIRQKKGVNQNLWLRCCDLSSQACAIWKALKFRSQLFTKKAQILTLPVAQQWHLSDRRTPRIHEILHVCQELLFLDGTVALASPYHRGGWPAYIGHYRVRICRRTLGCRGNGCFALIARLARRCTALFALPPWPSFQFWR